MLSAGSSVTMRRRAVGRLWAPCGAQCVPLVRRMHAQGGPAYRGGGLHRQSLSIFSMKERVCPFILCPNSRSKHARYDSKVHFKVEKLASRGT